MQQAEKATVEEWIAYCKKDPDATFFHTPYWSSLFTKWKPARFTTDAIKLVSENGDEAIVPFVKKRHLAGLMQIVISMPGTTYGGYVAPIKSVQLESMTFDYFSRSRGCIMRENPLNPIRLTDVSAMQVKNDVTHLIDLDKGYDAVWMQATAGHRNAVRNAHKSKVQIRLADTDKDWDRYYELYEESIFRWRNNKKFSGVSYDRTFFTCVKDIESNYRKLFIASVNGFDIAGILCFVWNRHFVVWHGAGSATHFSLHPNNMLYDVALQEAIRLRCSIFDCNPSNGLDGVLKFKQYLGAAAVQSRIFVRKHPVQKILDKIRRSGCR